MCYLCVQGYSHIVNRFNFVNIITDQYYSCGGSFTTDTGMVVLDSCSTTTDNHTMFMLALTCI